MKTLRNENCTRGNITSELENIIERLGSKRVLAQFVFVYCGHGVEDEGKRGWVAPYGFSKKKRLSSGLRMDKLNDLAEEVSASQQLWVFDCCHAGNVLKGTRGGGNARFALNKSRRSAVQAMTAVTRDQLAEESKGHGLFSKVFCQGLEAFKSESKYITFTTLQDYIDERVNVKSLNMQFATVRFNVTGS